MNTKHTPAPWNNSLTGIKDSNGKLIAQVWCDNENDSYGNYPAVSYSEMKANAKLIAAAPELLEALQLIANTSSDAPEAMRAIAKQAIKKATE